MRRPHVFLMAGEASSDAIGAKLMVALRREHGRSLRFTGVGGEHMQAAGLQSLFPMEDLSIMGFAEVVPALPRLALRLWQTISAARRTAPDIVVGIDSKAFCLRVLGALAADRRRGGGGPLPSSSSAAASAPLSSPALVQYVAPSAWAFSDAPRRAARLRDVVDELLVLLPFEAALYGEAGVRCTFVGHPALDDEEQDAGSNRPPLATQPPADAICLLPGSRRQEVESNLPLMLAAADRIAADARNGINQLLLPAPPSVRALVKAHVRSHQAAATAAAEEPLTVHVCSDAERLGAFRRSRLAIACSGTVNVQLARARVPQVAVYRSTLLTSLVVRHVLKPTIRHATLPNILNSWAGCAAADPVAGLIPELLFEDCTVDAIADAATHLLTDSEAAARQVAASERALDALVAERDARGTTVPSARIAARALLKYMPPSAASTLD